MQNGTRAVLIADTLTAKLPLMCNLYSITKGQSAIRDLFRVVHDRIGNVPPLPGIFPFLSTGTDRARPWRRSAKIKVCRRGTRKGE